MEQDQTIVSPSTYQVPVTPPRPDQKRTLIIAGVIVAILAIIGLAVAAFFYFPPFAALKSALTLPQELKGATFIADGPDGSSAYTLQGLSYKKTPLSGLLVSATPKLEAEIVRTSEGVFRVTIAGKEVFSTTTPIAGITSSVDHSLFAASMPLRPGTEFIQQALELPIFTLDATAWHILYHQSFAESALDIDGPTGVAPLLLADGSIIYVSPAGVSTWNPRTGVVKVLLPQTLRNSPIGALQSPDRTLIGFRDPVTKTLTVYKVTAASAEVVGTITLTESVTSYALGNDALYAVRGSAIGSEIWKQGFTEGTMHRIGFLPKALNITRLLIGSL